jgi:type II secretory pathway predicted ATPase ExeA
MKGWNLSRIHVVGVTIEEIRDNLQHRFEKAYFITGFASEEAKTLSFQSILLLLAEAVLPC